MKFPNSEMETILFYKLIQKRLGWEITHLQESFPDAVISKNGHDLKAEFEHEARTFYNQSHAPEGCDLIICWHNNWPDAPVPVWALDEIAQEEAETVKAILQYCSEPIANWIDFQNLQTERTEHLFSGREIAELLGLDRVTIWLRAKKIGVGRKIGKTLYYTEDEVKAIRNAPDGRCRRRVP